MECGEYIDIESQFKSMIIECDGEVFIKIDPSCTSNINTCEGLDCTQQTLSGVDLFNRLLNDAEDAFKVIGL